MAKQTINPGTAPTGAGGDTFRSGSAKLQANDDEIYSQLGANTQGVLPVALPVNKGGTGATTAAEARTNLGLGNAATRAVGTSAGNVMEVGAFGLGVNNNSSVFSISDETALTPEVNCFVRSENAATTALLPKFSVGLSVSRGTSAMAQLLLSPLERKAYFRFTHNAVASGAWAMYEVLHKGNTATDGNGFIKSASPIVQLYADKIELNDEAQQQNINFEKLGIGDYLIKGSSGFAQEGWYIETPKDANGNSLVAVVYEQLENQDISVKTYKKKFDLETASIVADLDNPVDITENRWIDLRLQELPQPEIEVTESIAPPKFQPTGLAQAVATVMESYHDPE